MNVPPTKESGKTNARLIAEQFIQPLQGSFEQYPGTELRRMLGRAYLDLEAERDALREALVTIKDGRPSQANLSGPQCREIARAALERPE